MDNMKKVGFMLAAGASFGAAGVLFYFLLKKDDYIMFEQNKMIMKTNKHIVQEINVPIDIVGALIGRQGANIKGIQEETCTRINFKDNDEDVKSRTALIRGSVSGVKSAAQKIQTFIQEQPKIITEEIYVPKQACGLIIGKGGENIRALHCNSKVKISIEPEFSQKDHLSLVTLRGSEEQICIAKQLIHEKVVQAEKRNKKESPEVDKTVEDKNKFNSSNIHHQLALTAPDDLTEDPSVEQTRCERLVPSGSDGYVETFSSCVISPSEFYLQNTGPRAVELDRLVENMTEFYQNELNKESHALLIDPIGVEVGDIVAAPFTDDQYWYRGEVKKITPNDYDPSLCSVDIFYIDFGDQRSFDLKEIYSLNEEFMNLPFQGIECCLHGVQPKNSSEWSNEAIITFENLIYLGEWKVIMARVVSNIKRNERKVAVVQLIDTLSEKDVNLSTELINRQFADPTPTDSEPES